VAIIPPPAPGWLSVLASQLSKKAANQFRRNAGATSCAMLDDIILPNVYKPGESFLALAADKKTSRDHGASEIWAEHRSDITWELVADQMFFTNALKPVSADDPRFHHPSQRVVFGGPAVLTFEFDQKDVGFFEQQCAWMRSSGKKDTDCRMGDVYRALSMYADFLGITVVWSGNKSFHIHVMFDPASMLALAPSVRHASPRAGFVSHWQALKAVVMPILNPVLDGVAVEPDNALQFPDAYRRLPLGTRVHDSQNFFGFPVGARIPQLVMWEKFRKQAATDAAALFFQAQRFSAVEASAKARRNRQRSVAAAKALPRVFTQEELGHFEAKIRETFPAGSYPEFVRFEHGATEGWRAMFRNHAGDRTPTSVMKEKYAGVHISGSNPLDLRSGEPRLARPLGESLATWARALRDPRPVDFMFDDGDPDDEDDPDLPLTITHLLGAGHVSGASALEQRFAREAGSREATPHATRRFFRRALLNSTIWVKGPEGSGKTTVLMKMTPGILDHAGRLGRRRRAMFAFTDYPSAEEKCAAFNAIQIELGSAYRGMVIPSFSRLYEAAVAAGMADQKITSVMAAQKGCASRWIAIERHQPKVFEWMSEYIREAYMAAGQFPVFFTVHTVAQQWKNCTYSRLMWGRNFWRDMQSGAAPKDRDADARNDTHLVLMVHDEIDASKVVAIEPAEIVEWVRALIQSDPAAWDPVSTSLAETYRSYDRFRIANPFPLVRGTQVQIDFEKAREIFHLGLEQWQELTLKEDGAYEEAHPDRPIYRDCVIDGHRWVAKPRLWWRGTFGRAVADRLIVLTTEMLPTAAVEHADPDGFVIYSLETPQIGRDTVDVHLPRSVTSTKMKEVCAEYQEKLSPDAPENIMVVSDSVKGQITDARSHFSARGSNAYIGRHVLQTMPFMHPSQHELLLALNAYTGRDDCVALYHLDRFNQTAGRNLGFRRTGDATHTLLINPRLYRFLLENHGWHFSRYDMLVHVDKRQREHLRAKPVAITPPPMAGVAVLDHRDKPARPLLIPEWDAINAPDAQA
jgi:hypothetical protein